MHPFLDLQKQLTFILEVLMLRSTKEQKDSQPQNDYWDYSSESNNSLLSSSLQEVIWEYPRLQRLPLWLRW